MRGALIVVEGLDRSGKQHNATNCWKNYKKKTKKVKLIRFPDRETVIGSMINKYLRMESDLDDHVIHLLFSANRWEKHKEMLKDLEDGVNLIVDRYAYSGAAYTSAKSVQGLTLDWCKQSDKGLPRPDLVLFFEVSEEVARKRSDFGGEKYEKSEFQRSVRSSFQDLRDEDWKIIDADQDEEKVFESVSLFVDSVLDAVKDYPIRKLWI